MRAQRDPQLKITFAAARQRRSGWVAQFLYSQVLGLNWRKAAAIRRGHANMR